MPPFVKTRVTKSTIKSDTNQDANSRMKGGRYKFIIRAQIHNKNCLKNFKWIKTWNLKYYTNAPYSHTHTHTHTHARTYARTQIYKYDKKCHFVFRNVSGFLMKV